MLVLCRSKPVLGIFNQIAIPRSDASPSSEFGIAIEYHPVHAIIYFTDSHCPSTPANCKWCWWRTNVRGDTQSVRVPCSMCRVPCSVFHVASLAYRVCCSGTVVTTHPACTTQSTTPPLASAHASPHKCTHLMVRWHDGAMHVVHHEPSASIRYFIWTVYFIISCRMQTGTRPDIRPMCALQSTLPL